jgi:heptosyltransferase-2
MRMLVVLPNWVGDLVLATPALRALRIHFADVHITGLIKSHLAEVLSGGDWMDELVHWPKSRSRDCRRQGFLGLASELRDRQFDSAVLLPNSFRSALLARLAGVRRRVGYDREGRGMLLTDRLLPHKFDGKYVPVPMIRYYNAIARYLGCRDCPTLPELTTTPEQETVAEAAIEAAGVEPDQPIVVVNPGASFGPAKRWPPERFAEVADGLAAENRAAVFIACGPKEIDVAHQVAGEMREQAWVLDHPVMRLGPLKALIRRASLLISNDTGPRHFANALGTPVVTVFGPTDPQWTATGAPNEQALIVPVDCGPCMKRRCPLDHRCMTRIGSDMVLAEARALLDKRLSAKVS